MSDAKTPKKAETVSKKNDTIKTEVSTNDTKSVESSASKSVSAPKSAAQSSISHFSSVSTPQYRSGWNSIFGDGNDTKKVVHMGEQRRMVAVHFLVRIQLKLIGQQHTRLVIWPKMLWPPVWLHAVRFN